MKVTPKTEAEVANVWPKGEYNAVVESAKEQQSKKGNEMIVLSVKVYHDDGRALVLNDYLMDALAYKVRHFCVAAGLLPKYEAGTLTPDDCVEKGVKVRLKIDPEKDGYPPKNSISDYVVAKDKPEPSGFATNRPKSPAAEPVAVNGGTPDGPDMPF